MNVWDYLDEYEAERHDILDAVDTVFRSGQLILGESVRLFEEEFASYCGAAFGIGVDNGTNAIQIGLRALGVRPGDDVITVANTAAPTVVAIAAAGARARFVDVDPDTYLMDTSALVDALTERTSCVVPVHLFGQCADMPAVGSFAAAHGLGVLEDCAQAHGATQQGRRAGAMGAAAAFSFYPTKVLGCYGDGGILLCDDEQVQRQARTLRYYGMDDRYYVITSPAHNSRLDTVQAEILRRKLKRLDGYIARRRQLARNYDERLADTSLKLPCVAPGNEHVYYLYVVRHPRRDEILEAMERKGVRLNVSYRWPVHVMSGFTGLGYEPGDLPVTLALADEIFSLPMYPSLTDDDQNRVCELLRGVLSRLD
ncbi:MAG: DegT/DnrJ/EryC1/StrS family aminotransferase [Actinobacteria bacterium]|nr:DegT/DnrJ/EryC1/StrS family aminotransferase [Actinomycetota bacterium]